MDKQTILQFVQDVTDRYDKLEYSEALINRVCASIANRVRTASSLVEQTVAVDITKGLHNIVLSPRFLSTAYVRPNGYNRVLNAIHPSKAFHKGSELVNVYYQSGNTLIVRLASAMLTDSLRFGWYSTPEPLVEGNDTNWVTLQYPELVIHLLASKVFNSVGDFDNGRDYATSAEMLYGELVINQSNAGEVAVIGAG